MVFADGLTYCTTALRRLRMTPLLRFQPAHAKRLSRRGAEGRWKGARSEWLDSRGRPRLEGMQIGSRQEERNFPSRVRQIHRHRQGLEPLPDHSRLGQVTANRAVRFVASPILPAVFLDLDGSRGWMGADLRIGPRIGPMVDAKNLVQARAEKRYCRHDSGEEPSHDRIGRRDISRLGPKSRVPQEGSLYTLYYPCHG